MLLLLLPLLLPRVLPADGLTLSPTAVQEPLRNGRQEGSRGRPPADLPRHAARAAGPGRTPHCRYRNHSSSCCCSNLQQQQQSSLDCVTHHASGAPATTTSCGSCVVRNSIEQHGKAVCIRSAGAQHGSVCCRSSSSQVCCAAGRGGPALEGADHQAAGVAARRRSLVVFFVCVFFFPRQLGFAARSRAGWERHRSVAGSQLRSCQRRSWDCAGAFCVLLRRRRTGHGSRGGGGGGGGGRRGRGSNRCSGSFGGCRRSGCAAAIRGGPAEGQGTSEDSLLAVRFGGVGYTYTK
jgi:hypothetical protein